VKAIAAGKEHPVAVKNNGTVWIWGVGTYGQLGDNGWSYRYLPYLLFNKHDANRINRCWW
jgi:alpha-tubulin suppressor-like RCC1 family protein